MDELENRRWKRSINPNDHAPISALKAAITDIETGKFEPRHIIVIIDDMKSDAIAIRQAGDRDYIGVIGLMEQSKNAIAGN